MKQQATSWYLLKSIAVKPPLTTDTTFGKELIKIFYGDDKARNPSEKNLERSSTGMEINKFENTKHFYCFL